MTNPQTFFASCPRGVEDLLQKEIQQLGADQAKAVYAGVEFCGDLKLAYQVCLWSRTASRVLMPLTKGEIKTDDDLYRLVQSINWGQHLAMDGSLAIDCHLSHSSLSNSHYASLKAKDAIVDQFRELYETRPDVERSRPDIRVNLHINKDQCTVSLDLSGEALHKRGLRPASTQAPMKENLAAAVLMRAGWPNESLSLVDLMCGSGTLLIEAALMALNIAPGIQREYFGFLNWKGHDAKAWGECLQEARAGRKESEQLSIRGYDVSPYALDAAKQNIAAAGLEKYITVKQRALLDTQPEKDMQPGLVIVNPPYGERMGDVEELGYLYAELGDIWKHQFANWTTALFTGNVDLARHIGLRAHKQNSFMNGPIACKLFQYTIRELKNPQSREQRQAKDEESRAMFRNRLKKNKKHIARWAGKNNIECYRVYDADLPEYAVAIDVYGDWVHIQEYQAPQSIDIRKIQQRIQHVVDVVPEVLNIRPDKLVMKTRRQQKGLQQYEKLAESNNEFIVHEGGLQFIVNLKDYLDTGLFLDHRITRQMVREKSTGKDFLNLFAYTGSVSVYAADGGAASTTTVDMSNTYLNWAKRNFELNRFTQPQHEFIKADCVQWLKKAREEKKRYDLIFLDPPTFSNSKTMEAVFDVQKDHPWLIRSAMNLLADGGELIFSNNFRKFKLDPKIIEFNDVEDISKQTIPEDFKRRENIHRCWIIRKRNV